LKGKITYCVITLLCYYSISYSVRKLLKVLIREMLFFVIYTVRILSLLLPSKVIELVTCYIFLYDLNYPVRKLIVHLVSCCN